MDDEHVKQPADSPPSPPKADGKKVLIVEDDPGGLELLKKTLSKQGFITLEAVNGQEGLEAACSMKPDLIVADVIMPEKDGFELLKELRQNDASKHIPVIFVSARKNMAESLLVSGADAFFSKPLDSSKFATEAVTLALKSHPQSADEAPPSEETPPTDAA